MGSEMTVVLCVLALGMVSASSFAAEGRLPDNRSLGSILNNDINNILYAVSGADTTPAEYKKAVMHLLDTQPGVLAQNVGLPDPVIYRTNIATTWDKYMGGDQAAAMAALLAAGTDPFTITIEACRARDVLVLASYRMNAEDFYEETTNMSDFGRAHKDLRIPGANCLDPLHPEVFDHRMAVFREVAENYDIDGIEFDFRRWTHMVSNPLENHAVLTRMVRETRKMLDEVAKKKGRPRLLLGARVAPMIEGDPLGSTDMSCKDLGLDVATWVKDGLVDVLCPSFFWGHNPGDDPKTAEFVALAKGTAVGIYPTVFPYSKWQKESPEAERIEPDETEAVRRYRDDILTAALKCYAEGADGISTFNWVPHQQPGMTRRNIRESWGLGAARIQMRLHPLLRDPRALEAELKSDVVLPENGAPAPH